MKYIITLILGLSLGLVLTSNAHTPCDDTTTEICGFEMQVNQRGELEQVWICRNY